MTSSSSNLPHTVGDVDVEVDGEERVDEEDGEIEQSEEGSSCVFRQSSFWPQVPSSKNSLVNRGKGLQGLLLKGIF